MPEETELYKLEETINYKFQDRQLLIRSLTHKSFLNETKNSERKDNERLEFLGDAVLELASTRHLFLNHPEKSEGEMTSYRSALVKGNHLAEVAKKIGLGEYLYLSKGEEYSGGRQKGYILANCVEALIGAIYLDGGNQEAEKFIEKFILQKLEEIIDGGLHIDAKSRFQEVSQEKEGITPHYEVLSESGPDHDKEFVVAVFLGKKKVAEGRGKSKQKAEVAAATSALEK